MSFLLTTKDRKVKYGRSVWLTKFSRKNKFEYHIQLQLKSKEELKSTLSCFKCFFYCACEDHCNIPDHM